MHSAKAVVHIYVRTILALVDFVAKLVTYHWLLDHVRIVIQDERLVELRTLCQRNASVLLSYLQSQTLVVCVPNA